MTARDFIVIVAISVLVEVAALGIGIWGGTSMHKGREVAAGPVDRHRYDMKVDLHPDSEIDEVTRAFIAKRSETAATETLARDSFDELGVSRMPPEVKPVSFDECKTPAAATAKLKTLLGELDKAVMGAKQLHDNPEAGLAKLVPSLPAWLKPQPGESFYLWDGGKVERQFVWVPKTADPNDGFWITAEEIEAEPAGGKPPATAELVLPLDNPPAALKGSFKCHLPTVGQWAAVRTAKLAAIRDFDDKKREYRLVIDAPLP